MSRWFSPIRRSRSRANSVSKPNEPATATANRRWTKLLSRALILAVVAVVGYLLFVEVSLWRGQVALETRQHERALFWLRAAQRVGRDNAELHFLLARCYRRLEQFDKVPAHLDRAWELGWEERPLERERWIAMAQTGQYEAVAPYWPQLLTDAGSDGPEISKAFVTGCLGRLRIGDAATILDAWQKDFPADPDPHLLRGRLNEVLLSWADAAKAYEQALAIAPQNLAARFGLAKALMKQNELEKAEHHLRVVIEQQPQNREAQLLLAQALIKSDRGAAAIESIDSLLRDNPLDADALLERGRVELGASNPQAAIPYLEKAIEQRPEDRQIAYQYAKALQLAGQREEARRYFAFVDEATKPMSRLNDLVRALLGDTDNIELRLEIASTIATYQSRGAAATWYHSILAMDPVRREAHAALAEYYERLGNKERSLFHRQRAGNTVAEADAPDVADAEN